jgi:guanylate kinase
MTVHKTSTGLAVCVSGPSGVGKGTIIKKVMQMRPEISHSISMTTRQPRPGEQHGVDYYFCEKEEFLARLAAGEILEYDVYCDEYYGTPKDALEAAVQAGKVVLLDITVPGSLSVMENYPDCVTIFVLPPSLSELQNRLLGRGTETAAKMELRLKKARDEVALADRFQYVVVNDDVTVTAECILSIIDAEHCRYRYMAGIARKVLNS